MLLIKIIYSFFYICELILFVSLILDILYKVNPFIYNYKFLNTLRIFFLKVTLPIVSLMKKIVNTEYKMFDFSYIILILLIEIIKNIFLLLVK
ncbi:MAG: YggT family protein [Spirochaetes bacterium]|nr:YggT family protein [Spirochaetota bacterium]